MLDNRKRLTAGLVSLLLGLGAGGAAVGAAVDNLANGTSSETTVEDIIEGAIDFSSGPVQCEIVANTQNGRLMMETVVHSLIPINGTYSIKIASYGGGNRSSIQQGGAFAVDADDAVILGRQMFGNRGATYDVSLKVTADNKTVQCEESFEV